jgi:hypothetical protein
MAMVNSAHNWFENDSRAWQDGVFYFLCAAYSVVAVFALVSFWLLRLPSRGFSMFFFFYLGSTCSPTEGP